MSQAEDLLGSLSSDDIALYTATPETEPHIVVDEDRFITVPDELKRIAVQYDHNVETVTFDCPRYWDGLDMADMRIYVNYALADGTPGCCLATNVSVDGSDSNIMHFDWTVSRNATNVSGPLTILICIKKTDEDGFEVNHWNSELNKEMYISKGLEVDEYIENKYPDIINQLLDNVDNIGGVGPYTDQREAVDPRAPFLFHYNDGTTSKEAYEAGQTYVDWRGRRYSIGENGVLTPYKAVPNENEYFDRLNCGYKEYTRTASDGSVTNGITLFDSNADQIVAGTGGYRQQGCFLYDDNGLVGFVTNLTTGANTTIGFITGVLQSHGSALSNMAGNISTISTDIRSLTSRIAVVEAFVNSITNVAEVGA